MSQVSQSSTASVASDSEPGDPDPAPSSPPVSSRPGTSEPASPTATQSSSHSQTAPPTAPSEPQDGSPRPNSSSQQEPSDGDPDPDGGTEPDEPDSGRTTSTTQHHPPSPRGYVSGDGSKGAADNGTLDDPMGELSPISDPQNVTQAAKGVDDPSYEEIIENFFKTVDEVPQPKIDDEVVAAPPPTSLPPLLSAVHLNSLPPPPTPPPLIDPNASLMAFLGHTATFLEDRQEEFLHLRELQVDAHYTLLSRLSEWHISEKAELDEQKAKISAKFKSYNEGKEKLEQLAAKLAFDQKRLDEQHQLRSETNSGLVEQLKRREADLATSLEELRSRDLRATQREERMAVREVRFEEREGVAEKEHRDRMVEIATLRDKISKTEISVQAQKADLQAETASVMKIKADLQDREAKFEKTRAEWESKFQGFQLESKEFELKKEGHTVMVNEKMRHLSEQQQQMMELKEDLAMREKAVQIWEKENLEDQQASFDMPPGGVKSRARLQQIGSQLKVENKRRKRELEEQNEKKMNALEKEVRKASKKWKRTLGHLCDFNVQIGTGNSGALETAFSDEELQFIYHVQSREGELTGIVDLLLNVNSCPLERSSGKGRKSSVSSVNSGNGMHDFGLKNRKKEKEDAAALLEAKRWWEQWRVKATVYLIEVLLERKEYFLNGLKMLGSKKVVQNLDIAGGFDSDGDVEDSERDLPDRISS